MTIQSPDFGRIFGLIEAHREQFGRLYALLLERNAQFNLTAITEEGEVFHKHFVDSLAGEHLFPQGAACAEVGSGAGFPSLPLAIVRGDLTFTLIESTGKKCAFLKEAVSLLGLSHVRVLCARAEEAARGAEREKYDVCFARAVARLNTLAEYCMPLVKKGGKFLAYKGAADELEEGKHAISVLGGGEVGVCRYELPEGYGARSLVLAEKAKPTPALYPRGRGAERRRPL